MSNSLLLGVLPGVAGSAYPASTELYVVFKSGTTIVGRSSATGSDAIISSDLSVVLEYLVDNNRTVIIAPGNYNMDTECNIANKANWSIIGAGLGTRITQTYANALASDTWEDGFRIDSCTGFKLADFYINGNGSNQLQTGPAPFTDNVGNCIHVISSTDGVIEVEATNAFFHGVFGTGTNVNVVTRNSHLHNNGYRGLHYHGTDSQAQRGCSILDCYLHNNGANANAGTNTGLFAILDNTSGTIVRGNTIEDEPGFGLNLVGNAASAGSLLPSLKSLISDNIVRRCGDGAYISESPTDMFLSGNLVEDCAADNTGTNGYGFFIKGALNLSLIGNSSLNNESFGLVFDSISTSQEVVVSQNIIKGNRGGGALIYNLLGGSISANTITDNNAPEGGQHQLRFLGTSRDLSVCGNTIVAGRAFSLSAGDITESGNVATLYRRSHGWKVGDVIQVGSVTPAGYNGSMTIVSVLNPHQVTYAVTGPLADSSGGTVTARSLGLGLYEGVSTVTNSVFSDNVININAGTDVYFAGVDLTVTGNNVTGVFTTASTFANSVMTGNTVSSTVTIAGSNNNVSSNYLKGNLVVSGDSNMLVSNRIDGTFTLSGNTNDLAYNSKAATDTGTGNEEVRTGWT